MLQSMRRLIAKPGLRLYFLAMLLLFALYRAAWEVPAPLVDNVESDRHSEGWKPPSEC